MRPRGICTSHFSSRATWACRKTFLLLVGIAVPLHAYAADNPTNITELPPIIRAIPSALTTIANELPTPNNFQRSSLMMSSPVAPISGEKSPENAGVPANHAPSIQRERKSIPADPNSKIFYKNKLDLSLEGGWLPTNVPFMFDFLVGDAYITEDVKYTMVPVFVSLDWQMGRLAGPTFLRGTWDATFGGTAAAIPKGPESRFFGYHMGIRRSFVQRRWRVVPYLDGRVGVGHIDARGPEGVWGAQGQDLVFSLNISSGARYQLTPRYAISAGVGYMHLSNMYLSLPRYANNGINVVGLMVGLHMRIPTRGERQSAARN